MPPEVPAGKTVTVHVQVSSTAAGIPESPTSTGGEIEPSALRPDQPLVIQVMARRNVEVVGPDRAELPIPASTDPPCSLFFDVKGISEGEGEVWVVVRQGQPSLLVLKLTPRVVAGAARAERILVRAEGGLPPVAPAGWALPTLRINERVMDGQIVFEYDLDLLAKGTYRCQTAPLRNDAGSFIRRIYEDLESRWIASGRDAKAFLLDMRGYGGTLWDKLFPTELQKRLWDNRNAIEHIRVLSTEPFVPWELVHLKKPDGTMPRKPMFLGQLGLVRWLFDGPGAAIGLPCRPGKVRFLIPDYPDRDYQLAEPATERQFLEATFRAKPVKPHVLDVAKLLRGPGKFDILHFAGHGVASADDVGDAMLMLQGRYDDAGGLRQYIPEYLRATTVRQDARVGKADEPVRPLVFLNACQVGRLSSIGGFAESFIMAGAGAFVSTLWNVGDEPAATFSLSLYEHLLAGEPMSIAAASAREQARAAGDATWLAYVVYAHPDAKLMPGAT